MNWAERLRENMHGLAESLGNLLMEAFHYLALFAIGAITPLRMGEGVRLIWARRRGIATGEAVVVWLVERMADFATLLAIVGTAGAAVLLQRMIPGIGPGIVALAVAGLVALAAVALPRGLVLSPSRLQAARRASASVRVPLSRAARGRS